MSLNFYEDRTWKLAGDAKVTKDAETQTIKLVSGPKTDWWRTPKGSEPESDVDRRSGPTYSTPVKGHKWSAGVWMRVDLKERFQQATLFVHAGPKIGGSGVNWLKAGIELDGGKENLGCVVTNPYSDWSTAPSPHSVSPSDPDGGAHWLWVQVERHGPDMVIYTALAPASSKPPSEGPAKSELTQGREVRGFALESQDEEWRVGVMVCGPLSQSATARFSAFSLELHD